MNTQAYFNRCLGFLKHFFPSGKTFQKSWFSFKSFMVDRSELLSQSSQTLSFSSQEIRFYNYLPPMERDCDRLERIYHQPSASHDPI